MILLPTAQRFRHERPGHATALLILCTSAGCAAPPAKLHALQQEIAALQAENTRLRDAASAQDRKIEALERGTENLRQLGDKRAEKLFRAQRLEIGKLSGGRDTDDQPGDDGVAVYLHLLDEQNNRFKAAGDIDVQVFDLDGPNAGEMIAQCHFDVDAARELWYGQLMTYHYKVVCPWTSRPPHGRQVVVQATFLDYLTGRALQDTRQVTVEPPPPAARADSGEDARHDR
jgi:FtsZ-binding cell division protein ZapB